MKKPIFITTLILLIIASCICLMACGKDDDGKIDKDAVGMYYTESLIFNDEKLEYFDKDFYTIDLKEDGTVIYNCSEVNMTMNGTWRIKGDKITFKFENSSMIATYSDGKIILETTAGSEFRHIITLARD